MIPRSAVLALSAVLAILTCPVPGDGEVLYEEDFSDGGSSVTVAPYCGPGSDWHADGVCQPDGANAPALPHARWGVPDDCDFYGHPAESNRSRMTRSLIFPGACIGDLELSFDSLLDFQEGPEFDRARVYVEDVDTRTDVADNGGGAQNPACFGGMNTGVGASPRTARGMGRGAG